MRKKILAAWFVTTSAVVALTLALMQSGAALATVGCPTPSPSTSSVVSPSPTGTSTAKYVLPGSVGYLGAPSALTVYQPGGVALPGCQWASYGLRCDNDNYTFDHVWIKGGVYWTGVGVFKLTNSIVQGGSGSEWYAFVGHPSTSGVLAGSKIQITDSTLGWLPGKTYPAGFDDPPALSLFGNQVMDLERDDVSGAPQGIWPTGGSTILDNYVHGLVQNGTASSPTHLDGIYDQNDGAFTAQGNYVDAPVRGDVTAAFFIQNRGSTDAGIRILDNYLNGGAYVLRNQTGVNTDVEGNTFGAGVYGLVSNETGTYGTWTGNVTTFGAVVPKP